MPTTPGPGPASAPPRLSICIATRNRVGFIGETLDAILAQVAPGVEVVVVDGASTDGTAELLRRYAGEHPAVRVHCEPVNSGVDGDYDRAVGYARGAACWLMTDDDLLAPGAVARILEAVADGPDLVVVNADVRSKDMATVLVPDRIGLGDREYGPGEGDRLLADLGDGLTFIGGVVIRRELWLARDRARYFGSLFVHVGVIFQAPIGRARLIGAPLIRIRYGNAGWTARTFEIWMFLWPRLIWSFPGLSPAAKARVTPAEPWRLPKTLLLQRAVGAYGLAEYRRLVSPAAGGRGRLLPLALAVTPALVANAVISLWILLRARRDSPAARSTAFDLARSPSATWLTRLAARAVGAAAGGGRPA